MSKIWIFNVTVSTKSLSSPQNLMNVVFHIFYCRRYHILVKNDFQVLKFNVNIVLHGQKCLFRVVFLASKFNRRHFSHLNDGKYCITVEMFSRIDILIVSILKRQNRKNIDFFKNQAVKKILLRSQKCLFHMKYFLNDTLNI